MVKAEIEAAIAKALQELGAGEARFVVERPASMEHGDYATNAALAAAKLLKKNPNELAQELVQKLTGKIEGIEKITSVGGFVNFVISYELTSKIVRAAIDPEWGSSDLYKGKRILVEYTSPNLFKPLHIGNLIGNILGESIARLLENSGAEVKRINYPSDIGLTIAKGVWGLQKSNIDIPTISQLGQAYVAGNAAYEDGSGKEEIEEINRALYQDTDDSNKKWHELRTKGLDVSLRHILELTKILQTKPFDFTTYESQSGLLGQKIVKNHIGDVFELSEGAVIYRGEQDGLHTRVFLNSQGLPTYEAKEVGLFQLKADKYPEFDISITVTGSEQKDFFRVIFAVIKKLFPKIVKDKNLYHVATGFLKLTTGKMSSRLGNVITGESLLADLTKESRNREDVAVGAIKYVVLKSGSGKDIVFDPEKSLSLEGDSGPYLQYALVRARALLRKATEAQQLESMKVEHDKDFQEVGFGYRLRRILGHFPEVVARAAKEMEPHHVTTYLTELASTFNSWYGTERIIVDGQILKDRPDLIKAVENTLVQGLNILGIPAPEEM